jgi:hypothetical protein
MTDLTSRQMLDLIIQTLDANKKRFAVQRKRVGRKLTSRSRAAKKQRVLKAK